VCDLSKLEISGKVGSYNMCVTLIMEYLAHAREWIRLKFISSPRSPCPITALATLEKGVLVRLTSPCCCRGSHGSNRYPSSLSSITSSRRLSPFLVFLLVWGAACIVGWPRISFSKLWAVCSQSCLTLCDPMDYSEHAHTHTHTHRANTYTHTHTHTLSLTHTERTRTHTHTHTHRANTQTCLHTP